MAGGSLGAIAIVLHYLQPTGCVGAGCGVQPMRSASGLVTVIGAAAALLVLVGVIGLTLMARQSGRSTRLMRVGMAFAAVGFLVLLAAVIFDVYNKNKG